MYKYIVYMHMFFLKYVQCFPTWSCFCPDLATKSSSSPKKKVAQSTLPFGKTKSSTPSKVASADVKKPVSSDSGSHNSSPVKGGGDENSKDNTFREFRRICINLAEEPSYNNKSKILADFFEKGSSGGKAEHAVYM